jgi:hypothetical protein
MYEIMGMYKGNPDQVVIDSDIRDQQEAEFMVQMYRISYGESWVISYKRKEV